MTKTLKKLAIFQPFFVFLLDFFFLYNLAFLTVIVRHGRIIAFVWSRSNLLKFLVILGLWPLFESVIEGLCTFSIPQIGIFWVFSNFSNWEILHSEPFSESSFQKIAGKFSTHHRLCNDEFEFVWRQMTSAFEVIRTRLLFILRRSTSPCLRQLA